MFVPGPGVFAVNVYLAICFIKMNTKVIVCHKPARINRCFISVYLPRYSLEPQITP